MKKMLLLTVGALTLTASLAGQALAQPYGGDGDRRDGYRADAPRYERAGGWEIEKRIHWVQERINRGRADGALDRHEFRRVQGELNHLTYDVNATRRSNGGHIPGPMMGEFQNRLDRLNDQMRWLRHNDVRRPW